jgi:DNA-binding beta-propeller fold protein YncE
VNSDGTLSNFAITTSLQTKNVSFSTLSPTSQIVNLMPPSSGLWATDLNGDVVDLFQGSPQAFKLAIPVATSAARDHAGVYRRVSIAFRPARIRPQPECAGYRADDVQPDAHNGGRDWRGDPDRDFQQHDRSGDPGGQVPRFAVPSSDQQRLFVLNRGDDTISVINTRNNTLDACTPFQNQNGQWITCHPRPFSFRPVRGRSTRNTTLRPSTCRGQLRRRNDQCVDRRPAG